MCHMHFAGIAPNVMLHGFEYVENEPWALDLQMLISWGTLSNGV